MMYPLILKTQENLSTEIQHKQSTNTYSFEPSDCPEEEKENVEAVNMFSLLYIINIIAAQILFTCLSINIMTNTSSE
jgi:hypothetical protein